MVQAWSIPTAQRGNLGMTGGPGPGQYAQEKKQKKIPPSWKIGTSERTGFNANNTPGPGNYQLRPQTGTGQKYSMATKAGIKPYAMSVPGPGNYNPRPQSAQTKAPQYSMGSRFDQAEQQNEVCKNVGPGSYQFGSTLTKAHTKIGTGQRSNLGATGGFAPGPGQYNISKGNKGQKAKIGTSQRQDLNKNGTDNIGPGQYEAKSCFDQNKGVSITAKRQYGDQNELSRVPGPGSYNPDKQQKKTAPTYKIGTSTRGELSQTDKQVPGPGNYSLSGDFRGAKVKIGTDVRRPLNDVKGNPGPGNYEMRSAFQEGPKYSIKGGAKVDPIQREKQFTPGPGQYAPVEHVGKQRPASAKIGTSTRPDFLKSRDTPGPGNYDGDTNSAARRTQGPSYGFGTGKRAGPAKVDVPGPGNYAVKSTFADVPKYNMNSTNSKKR